MNIEQVKVCFSDKLAIQLFAIQIPNLVTSLSRSNTMFQSYFRLDLLGNNCQPPVVLASVSMKFFSVFLKQPCCQLHNRHYTSPL